MSNRFRSTIRVHSISLRQVLGGALTLLRPLLSIPPPPAATPAVLATLLVSLLLLGTPTPGEAREYTAPNVLAPFGLEVNTYSGSLFYMRTDYYVHGKGVDLNLKFSYNSGETSYDYGYGGGWTHSFNEVYERQGPNISIKRWDGDRNLFTLNGTSYTPPVACFDSLTQYQPGKFRLRTKAGLAFYFDDSTHKRVTSIRDPNGNALTIAYAGGRPSAVTDVSGRSLLLQWTGDRLTEARDFASPNRTTSYQYDAAGNLTRATNAVGASMSYAYDDHKRLVRLTDARGGVCQIAYDDSGAVVAIQSPLSSETFAYDPVLHKTTHTIAGLSTTYTFDALARVIAIEGICCGYHRRYQYDAANNIVAVIDANGNTTTSTFDARGNRLTETDPLGQIFTFTYEPVFCLPTSITDRAGNTTNLAYDSRGNCTGIDRPGGCPSHFSYDSFGQLATHTDGLGRVTTFTYNGAGYRTGIAHPIGSESFTYDAVGLMQSETDANGNTSRYSWDHSGRLVAEENALSEITSYVYDESDNLVTSTYPNGNVVSVVYDALNRRTAISDGLGIVQTNTYDGAGNLATMTDGNGNTTVFGYDGHNRVASITRAGIQQSLTYDANGNVLTRVDGNGHPTAYTYDGRNRQVTASKGGVTTRTGYDAAGNPAEVWDGNGNATQFSFDAMNRLIRETRADGLYRAYDWDCNNNRVSRTDFSGVTTTYSYDGNNLLTGREYPGGNNDLLAYDAGGRLLQADNNDASITYEWDAGNRVLSETLNGHRTGYAYSTAARQRVVSYPGGSVAEERRNLRGRIVSVTRDGQTVSAEFDPAGRMTRVDHGGVLTTEYTYNQRDLVTEIAHLKDGAWVVGGVNYEYDGAGNRTAAIDLWDVGRVETYEYNGLDWLTEVMTTGGKAADRGGNASYDYDQAGNWTVVTEDGATRTYTTNGLNQYTTCVPGGPFSYDASGNMTSSAEFTASYNYENQLGHAVFANPPAELFNTYDALGRRIRKVMDGETVNYYYDGDKVIETRDGADAVIVTYGYGDDGVQEMRTTSRDQPPLTYLKSANGSVMVLADQAGERWEQYEYSGFGSVTIRDGCDPVPLDGSACGNPFMVGGGLSDIQGGLVNGAGGVWIPGLGRYLAGNGVGGSVVDAGLGVGTFVAAEANDGPPVGGGGSDGPGGAQLCSMGEPVPGAEILVEQEPNNEPLVATQDEDAYGMGLGSPSNGNAYALSLGTLGGVSVARVSAAGAHPVDFIGASVGDPAICSNSGPYSQSLSNMEDNGLTASTDDGPAGRPVDWPAPSNSGPYSQSLSNMEDNGIISTGDQGPMGPGMGDGTGNGNRVRRLRYRAWPMPGWNSWVQNHQ